MARILVADDEPGLREFVADALELAHLAPGERVLDVATGPGTLALAAARAGARVSAIDFSPEMIAELGSILSKCPGVRYKPVIHLGTLHGYALPDRDIYAKAAAERDWELIFAMYHRQIPPYAQ